MLAEADEFDGQAELQAEASSGFLHHFAVLPDDDGQAECAVLGFDIVGDTAESTFGASHERRSFPGLGGSMSVLFHTPINFRTNSIS